MIAGEENPISSRLQIKQYLWAIVIKGKFNSLLMPHYAWLGKVRWGCAAPSVGAEVTGNFSPRSAPCMVLGSQQCSRRGGHTEAPSGSYRSDLQGSKASSYPFPGGSFCGPTDSFHPCRAWCCWQPWISSECRCDLERAGHGQLQERGLQAPPGVLHCGTLCEVTSSAGAVPWGALRGRVSY